LVDCDLTQAQYEGIPGVVPAAAAQKPAEESQKEGKKKK
jgi:hypothetical protein